MILWYVLAVVFLLVFGIIGSLWILDRDRRELADLKTKKDRRCGCEWKCSRCPGRKDCDFLFESGLYKKFEK